MNSAHFVALFWGWLSTIFAGILFIRPKVLHDIKRIIVEQRSFALSYGILSLILGLLSVLIYGEWTWHWHVIITIFGWLALLKGIIVLATPEVSKNVSYEKRILSTRISLIVVGALAITLLIATYAEM